MNQVTLIGNLGKDPEGFTSSSGKPGCKFSLATRKTNDEGADWHNITVYGNSVGPCLKFLHKGSKVLIQGSLWYRSDVDNQGNRQNYCGISCYTVEFLSQRQAQPVETPDDIPF
tara:strand:+ start:692 stop:1033 length:342 start_codon:yes stop_codon:yes gene_type:complete